MVNAETILTVLRSFCHLQRSMLNTLALSKIINIVRLPIMPMKYIISFYIANAVGVQNAN